MASGVTQEGVSSWSSKIEAKLGSVDESVGVAKIRLNEIKKGASLAEEGAEEASLCKKRNEQLKFERAQLKLKLEYERKTVEVNKSEQGQSKAEWAKLPKKLSITKFDGTCEGWLPFWNKFVAEFD